SVWVTFNGEVYNFEELRQELLGKGHTFRSRTDTECLVHLYEELGEEMVPRLRGMFSFAIWDAKNRRLLAARDRLGKKPFHYREDADAFRFASEPSALHVGLPGVEPDLEAVHLYIHFGYVPCPRSAFAGARKLPPAHLLVWEPGKRARVRRYWQVDYRDKLDASSAAARARIDERTRELILEATRLRLISDVPLGAFLSGGIDSSSVVAAMAQAQKDAVKTFTIGFAEKVYDERPLARAVAHRWRTDHTERLVEPDLVSIVPELVRHYGEPFADSSALPTWAVSKVARERVTVALSGDGGDETWGGYVRFKANEIAALYGRFVPAPARQALLRVFEAVPRAGRGPRILRFGRRFTTTYELGNARRNAEWGLVVKRSTTRTLYAPEFEKKMSALEPASVYLDHWQRALCDTDAERALYTDLALYMPDDVMTKVDIASMCHGLECRAPLLDHHLVEHAARVPPGQKFSATRTKIALKRAVRAWLPPVLLDRPKRGFAVPLGSWLRGPLLPLLRDTLLSSRARAREIFEPRAVERLIDEHVNVAWDWGAELWGMLWLELWFRDQIDGRAPAPAPALAAAE
ncbi:MAG TPA: asparagine synthase (glutamine-hydrolyzing), partial [Planctomycetota bacterium]|nr:asparagine synthase (glutamine-hydrolyzing) [Planctomycetota bacterium]